MGEGITNCYDEKIFELRAKLEDLIDENRILKREILRLMEEKEKENEFN